MPDDSALDDDSSDGKDPGEEDAEERERLCTYVEPELARGVRLKASLEGLSCSALLRRVLRAEGLRFDQVLAETVAREYGPGEDG